MDLLGNSAMDVWMSIVICANFVAILENVWRIAGVMSRIGEKCVFKAIMLLFVSSVALALLMTLQGCSRRENQRTSKVSLPNGKGTISIIYRFSPRAMTSEGQERALMLELADKDPVFFKYPQILAGETTKIEVYWHSNSHMLRFKDTMAQYHMLNANHECVLDIGALNLRYIVRDPNGHVYTATISGPYNEIPLGSSYRKPGTIFPDIIMHTASPYEPVIEGQKSPICQESWISEEGILLGHLE